MIPQYFVAHQQTKQQRRQQSINVIYCFYLPRPGLGNELTCATQKNLYIIVRTQPYIQLLPPRSGLVRTPLLTDTKPLTVDLYLQQQVICTFS